MNIEQLIYTIIAALFAISIHEFAHAYVAHRFGDPTPQALGRLTLNPLKHLDPIGILMLVIFRVGWAKPVQINPLYFKNRRRSVILVSIAGPLANVTLAWLLNLLSYFVFRLPLNNQLLISLYILFSVNIELNVFLAAFNLLPIPPLDGSRVVANLLPINARLKYESLAPYAPFILILGIWTGLLHHAVNPIARFLFFIVEGFTL